MIAVSTSIALVVALALTGLWSGLLLTVSTLLHPTLRAMDARGQREFLGRFLAVARRSPTNYVLVVGMVLAAAAALVSLRDDTAGTAFRLVLTGLALVLVGAIAISRWVAEPNYDVLLAWDPATPQPASWPDALRRYFRCNWLRGLLVWSGFVCFLAATASEMA